jgi:hypothetical protein
MNNSKTHMTSDQLQAFLDHNLEDQEMTVLEDHLETCSLCRKEVEKQMMLISRLEKLPEISLDIDLTEAVLSKLRDQNRSLSGITWTLVIEALAAGAVISAIIPVIKAAPWLADLVNIRQEILAGANIFLTQLASTWIFWWSKMQLDLRGMLDSLQNQALLTTTLPSPWILILAAGGLAILVNYLFFWKKPIKNYKY